MITKEVEPDLEMHSRASREIAASTPRGRMMVLLLVVLLLLSGSRLLSSILSNSPLREEIVWFVGACLLIALLKLPAVSRLRIRRDMKRNPHLYARQRYELTPDGLHGQSGDIDIRLPWDKIVRIHMTRHFLLLFTGPDAAFFIPRTVLTDGETAQIRSWAGR